MVYNFNRSTVVDIQFLIRSWKNQNDVTFGKGQSKKPDIYISYKNRPIRSLNYLQVRNVDNYSASSSSGILHSYFLVIEVINDYRY